jgi:hypothetical protein
MKRMACNNSRWKAANQEEEEEEEAPVGSWAVSTVTLSQ